MTLTFESDNDIIVYALEKIIVYTRRTQQIFMAQCVWWLASVIGLEPSVVIHINNLHGRIRVYEQLRPEVNPPEDQEPLPKKTREERQEDIRADTVIGLAKDFIDRSDKERSEKLVSPTSRDLHEDLRLGWKEKHIHPDRRNQVPSTNLDISDLDLNASEPGPRPDTLASTERFLQGSQKERKAFSQRKKAEQLSRTRSGKVIAKPLTQGQRRYLQGIPKNTIRDYLDNKVFGVLPKQW
jgi:hypothetical protein